MVKRVIFGFCAMIPWVALSPYHCCVNLRITFNGKDVEELLDSGSPNTNQSGGRDEVLNSASASLTTKLRWLTCSTSSKQSRNGTHNLLEIYRRGDRNSVAIFSEHRQVRSPLLTRVLIEVAIVPVICKRPAVPYLLA